MVNQAGDVGRVVTVPNALSVLRLVCIPVFCWLVLVPQLDGLAFLVLALAGVTDFLDGYLARRWNQQSRIGTLLDPAADRLTSIAVPIVLALRGIVPWWFVLVLLARDLVVGAAVVLLARRRRVTIPVTFVGKAATFCLLCGFPLVLLGTADGAIGTIAFVTGWAFTLWGTALYWWSAVTYLQQMLSVAANPAPKSVGRARP